MPWGTLIFAVVKALCEYIGGLLERPTIAEDGASNHERRERFREIVRRHMRK